MSWFDGKLELGPEVERFRETLDEIGREMRSSYELMVRISDDVFTAIGEEALEEAQGLPVKPATIDRVTPTRRRKDKRAKKRGRGQTGWKTRRRGNTSSEPFANRSHTGVEKALTAKYLDKSGGAVALREITGDNTLVWGSKRWINFLHPHIDGTKRGLPARLSLLSPRRFEPEAAEKLKDVLANYVAGKLEKAGAPYSWVQEILEDRA